MKSYTELCKQMSSINLEIRDMDLHDLIDECSHLLIMYDSVIMDKIIKKYLNTGKLDKDEIRSAKALYILAYGKDTWII